MADDRLFRELHDKAYAQGYHAGRNALPWSAADWEIEFVPSYRRGHNDGVAERQREMNQAEANP